MAKAGVAEEKRAKREEHAAKANELAQLARGRLLEARQAALNANDQVAAACFSIAINAIDNGYVKAS